MSPKGHCEITCMEAENVVDTVPHRKKKGDVVCLKQQKNSNVERRRQKQTVRLRSSNSCVACAEEKTPEYLCSRDINVQTKNMEYLLQTGWSFAGMSISQGKFVLAKSDVGTFLIRDSSDPNFLFSVSVKTPRGPTSVRVIYFNGYFQLDCDSKIRTVVPKFETVVALVDYYVRLGLNEENKCRWLESSGRKDLPIVLNKPKVNNLSDLKHLCRLSINRSLPVAQLKTTEVASNIDKLGLPRPLSDYIKYYPHLN